MLPGATVELIYTAISGRRHGHRTGSSFLPTVLHDTPHHLNVLHFLSLQSRLDIKRFDKFKGESGTANAGASATDFVRVFARTAYLSAGDTGSFLSTSFPPLAKMKCPRFVLPAFESFAPSAATKTRSGSDSSGYGNSFCKQERINPQAIQVYCRSASYLELPLLLILGFVVTETIHGEIVLREIRIDITKPARLCRATRCVLVNGKLHGLEKVS